MSRQVPMLRWASDHGVLATALGVTDAQAERVSTIVQDIYESGGGIRLTLDALQRELPDMSIEEWTAAVFAIGYFDAQIGGGHGR